MDSTTLQLKISKTKKRLSSDRWSLSIITISLMGLIALMIIGLRATSLSHAYGVVNGEIPVLSVPIEDPALHRFKENPEKELSKTTTTIVMSNNGDLFFGDMDAFGENFHLTRNKFVVRQQDGKPQLGNLFSAIKKWLFQREAGQQIKNDKIVVLVPANGVPLNIVIQVISELRASRIFEHVILGSGLL